MMTIAMERTDIENDDDDDDDDNDNDNNNNHNNNVKDAKEIVVILTTTTTTITTIGDSDYVINGKWIRNTNRFLVSNLYDRPVTDCRGAGE